MIFLRVESVPVRQFYSGRDVLPFLDAALPRHDLLLSVGEISASASIGGGDEVSNLTVYVQNQSYQMQGLYPVPPLGARATVYRIEAGAAVELYTGTIQSVGLGQVADLVLESERMTELVPLRSSTAWDSFREPVALPHVYGRGVTSRLIQYSQDRRLFAFADHPCAGVDSVFINGLAAPNWQSYSDEDSTGRRIQFVEFQSPVDEGVEIWATGRGKLDQRTGSLIENPADVITDLRAEICGHSFTAADIDAFRVQCGQLGVTCAGVIQERITVRATVDAICNSVGAVWDDTAFGFARIYPGPIGTYVKRTIPRSSAVTPRAELTAIVTRVRCEYDVNHATGEPRASVEIQAAESVRQYGDRPLELVLPWVNSSRVAYQICERLLQHRARPQIVAQFGSQPKILRPLDLVRFDHPAIPSTDAWPVASALISPDGFTSGSVSIPVGSTPAVSLVRRTTAIGPEAYAGATVAVGTDDIVFTILDATGAPLAGFAVTLDAQYERTTDAGGRVSFPRSLLPRGLHRLTYTHQGVELGLDVTI